MGDVKFFGVKNFCDFFLSFFVCINFGSFFFFIFFSAGFFLCSPPRTLKLACDLTVPYLLRTEKYPHII